MTRTVAFVGPLPPPLHGFSDICAAMLALFRRGATVAVFDRAPRVEGRGPQLLRQLREAARYSATVATTADICLYLALSGGLGQLIDGFYVVIARAFHKPIFVHHHSFAYLTRSTLINRLLFSQLRGATHIVLSEGMSDALAARYRIDKQRITVVSNAAFCEPPTQIIRAQSAPGTPIRIGFLSNITVDKGIVEFFGVLTELARLAVPYRAYIAGPVASSVHAEFDRLLSASRQVEYVGPVYDDAKTEFYQRLDVLLFPTKYANEAEPLVVHEALRNAVHVIACARGAIPEMLSNGAGLVFDQTAFVVPAAAAISAFSADRARLAHAQELSFVQARRLHLRASSELTEVVTHILACA